MIIATGKLSGRNQYILEGTFSFQTQADGSVLFLTSEDFFFGDKDGNGTPAPGFALHKGSVDALSRDALEVIARETRFLSIADQAISVSGQQSAILDDGFDLGAFDTVFLWCFAFPVLLGVGDIITAAPQRS